MSKSSKSARDNRANQLNPRHPAYHQSRGSGPDEAQRMAGRPSVPPVGRVSPQSPDGGERRASQRGAPSPSPNRANKG